QQRGWNGTRLSSAHQSHLRLEELLQLGKGIADEAGVVTDELSGCVDLVCDAGGKLADGFHLLRVAQLHFQPLTLLVGLFSFSHRFLKRGEAILIFSHTARYALGEFMAVESYASYHQENRHSDPVLISLQRCGDSGLLG